MRHRIFTLLLLLTVSTAKKSPAPPPQVNSIIPSDAAALLTFKSKADTDNKLLYILNERFDHCQWQGVKCAQGRVVRVVLQSFGLRGIFPPNSLSSLDQLRVLRLSNNSLAGPIPNLAGLVNLKSLLLDGNSFSDTFHPSILSLHRLRILDLSHNNFSGSLPVDLTILDRLNSLRLERNRFNGSIPPLNQSSLVIFNVSGNNLTGPIPVTPTLSRFGISSFLSNPNLCGKILNRICHSTTSPFFDSPGGAPSPKAQSQGGAIDLSPPSSKKKSKTGVILGVVIGFLILIAAILSVIAFCRNRNRQQIESKSTNSTAEPMNSNANQDTSNAMQVLSSELQKKVAVAQREKKSGNLIFVDGETPFCTLEQLMRASAELLGRGTIGTTYKAVMANQLSVTVKRLDAGKTGIMSGEAFERHMEAVGGLRHPNLVAMRAYFQAKQEKLIIYDFQPNGSLLNLIHGSRSTRAKPLHWTSCLKIAEDVAMGLAYIHQASRLSHGNLKSSNILLGADFEACLTDYCLVNLADSSTWNDDLNSAGYKAPEMRKSSNKASTNSDVYAFGILLLELLTGKPPLQHPFLAPTDTEDWVRAMRMEDDVEADNRLKMLVQVAVFCTATSPDQRPTMRQVVRMVQEIKETAMIEEDSREAIIEYL